MTVSAPERQRIIARLDEVMQELVAIRRLIEQAEQPVVMQQVTEHLFGSLGHGTWEEYDLSIDWTRFGTP